MDAELPASASAGAGGATDALTQAILDRLNDEVARLYGEAAGEAAAAEGENGGVGTGIGGHGGEGGSGDGYGGDEGYGDDGGASASASASRRGGLGTTQMPKGPTPADLWRAAHEVPRQPKEKVVLSDEAWRDLVGRLNDSSKKKETFLLKAQHKQLADQLAGLTFTPAISQRSRELAARNDSLPVRVAALMRKKKAKIESIRNEKLQKEQAEAPFRPNLNKPRTAADGAVRKIGHLMQYEIDRRLRAEQRRMIVDEMESRELTFKPHINPNSGRIVARLQEERQALEASGGAAPPSPAAAAMLPPPPTAMRAQKKALVEQLAQAGGVPSGAGNSSLPGHEQETFQPVINARSRALHRPGVDDVDVYTRLYALGAGASSGSAASVAAAAAGGSGKAGSPLRAGGARGALAAAAAAAAAEEEDDEAGGGGGGEELGPGHPQHFTTVAYEGRKMDFILRRVQAGPEAY